MADYGKQKIAVRYWLLGAGYHKAAEAMSFAEGFHTGTRKDGVTPEFAHQVAIASYLRTLHTSLRHPELTFSLAWLHDVREDYDVPDQAIRSRFGDRTADNVDKMTKVFQGVVRDEDSLFAAMAESPEVSICKLSDRIHNHSSMLGVFSDEKMERYMDETTRLFLPMLKNAKRNFPDQEPAYENAKLVLHSQMTMLSAVIEARAAAASS